MGVNIDLILSFKPSENDLEALYDVIGRILSSNSRVNARLTPRNICHWCAIDYPSFADSCLKCGGSLTMC